MTSKQLLLWDLDGTLTDPMVGITSAVQHALRAFQIDPPDRQALTPFIGPPLLDMYMETCGFTKEQESFQRFYGFSEEQARKAVAAYREYFADTGLYENEVYPGIPELLADLKDAGKTLALATSKPAVFAERILEHFQLRKYFSLAAGSELDGTRVHKADVIAYALEQTGFSAADALMIGDRCYDIDGARAVGTQALGVAYGYGSREELEKAGASKIAENVEDLRKLLW